ncbi:hypothetical protein NQ314_009859 [Rhamnusium bicolor]|uniref:BPTI/Kunitz inhibitor domain-containing protein n=1 Tax=Rhamnusium bicolor TaxID=1586634 RepID=A0AAV8XVK7_9CUCU|nr:hypothetical protein NQ314_009859 [Rhamnusium bicolor]
MNCVQPHTTPGPMCLAYIIRYYWNSSRQRCDQFIYGGCRATINNFETRRDCELIAGRVCRT